MAEREIGRETSHNLAEIRTVLSRAETALTDLRSERVEAHYWHGDKARPAQPCSADCPKRLAGEIHGTVVDARYHDPDFDEAHEALSELVRKLDRFRRTGRPRKS